MNTYYKITVQKSLVTFLLCLLTNSLLEGELFYLDLVYYLLYLKLQNNSINKVINFIYLTFIHSLSLCVLMGLYVVLFSCTWYFQFCEIHIRNNILILKTLWIFVPKSNLSWPLRPILLVVETWWLSNEEPPADLKNSVNPVWFFFFLPSKRHLKVMTWSLLSSLFLNYLEGHVYICGFLVEHIYYNKRFLCEALAFLELAL